MNAQRIRKSLALAFLAVLRGTLIVAILALSLRGWRRAGREPSASVACA